MGGPTNRWSFEHPPESGHGVVDRTTPRKRPSKLDVSLCFWLRLPQFGGLDATCAQRGVLGTACGRPSPGPRPPSPDPGPRPSCPPSRGRRPQGLAHPGVARGARDRGVAHARRLTRSGHPGGLGALSRGVVRLSGERWAGRNRRGRGMSCGRSGGGPGGGDRRDRRSDGPWRRVGIGIACCT